MKIICRDKNDPRIFVYKNERHRWLGVTFNFAHAESWLWLAGLLVSGGVPFFVLRLHRTAGVLLLLVWLALVVTYCFRRAARERREHPPTKQ